MVVVSVFILFVIFESSKQLSDAVNTYCTLPCPFMCPAQEPSNNGNIQMIPRGASPKRRSYEVTYTDYEEDPTESSQPSTPPPLKSRQQPPPADPDPPAPQPQPKPKPKPSPAENPEPPQKKRNSSPQFCPTIQPSRRFFTSLFSIPGAVVDTLIGGEITL